MITNSEFIALYPDSDNGMLAEKMKTSPKAIYLLGRKLGLAKSKRFHATIRMKAGAVRRLRCAGAFEQAELITQTPVCMENYDTLDRLCANVDVMTGRGLTEKDIESLIERNIRRSMDVPTLSQEWQALLKERNELYFSLYALSKRTDKGITDEMVEGHYNIGTL